MKTVWPFLMLIVPAAFAAAHEATGKYIFSPLVSLSCALIVFAFAGPKSAWAVILGLLLSVVGDWFMAHQSRGSMNLMYGIGFFFGVHALFCVYSVLNGKLSAAAACVFAVCAVLIGWYAFGRALIHIPAKIVRVGFVLYAGISALSLALASAQTGPWYAKGLFFLAIVLIAISDIFISENDFVHVKGVGKWICPLYYACHIVMTASVLSRALF